MRRLLLLCAALAGTAVLAPAANACTIDTCWFTQPVCSRVDCTQRICTTEGWCVP